MAHNLRKSVYPDLFDDWDNIPNAKVRNITKNIIIMFEKCLKILKFQVYLASGLANRTISSALSFSSGFFPENQAPNKAPFPIHQERAIDEVDNVCILKLFSGIF